MKYRLLAAAPFLVAAALVIGGLTLADPTRFFFYVHRGMPALACVGMLYAATRFGARDHMCWAWSLQGISYGLLVASALLFGNSTRASIVQLSHAEEIARSGIAIAVNVVAVVGMFLFARAFAVAGLALAGERWKRLLVLGAGAAVAIAVAGPAAVGDFRALRGGDLHGIVSLASDLGDAISFALVGPVLLNAIALRGGLLAWPWTLLTASWLCWLLYDCAGPLTALMHFSAGRARLTEEVVVCLANGLSCAAGIAQVWVASYRPVAPGAQRVATPTASQ